MHELTRLFKNETETARFGAALGRLLRRGDVVCLSGPLGAGKTTLARGLIAALTGVEAAPSPTFALALTYPLGDMMLSHFDLYRLDRPEEVVELGLEEAFDEGIVLVEWPERVAALLPEESLLIRLEPQGESRRARIFGGRSWEKRLADLQESPKRTP
jgi:tRNA threonylcarbamoyl adenosine modification protein YjeE